MKPVFRPRLVGEGKEEWEGEQRLGNCEAGVPSAFVDCVEAGAGPVKDRPKAFSGSSTAILPSALAAPNASRPAMA